MNNSNCQCGSQYGLRRASRPMPPTGCRYSVQQSSARGGYGSGFCDGFCDGVGKVLGTVGKALPFIKFFR